MDYETFVNAAFFLQGKADQFAQQQPGKRKEILGNILGLETWEKFREKTSEQRRNVERDLASKDGQIQEIEQELSEESERKDHLKDLEEKMVHISVSRKTQELSVEQMKRVAASLDQQRKLVETLKENLDKANGKRDDLVERKKSRTLEMEKKKSLLNRAEEIKQSYEIWLEQQKKLESMDVLAQQYKVLENESHPLIRKIESEKVRLVSELSILKTKENEIQKKNELLPGMNSEISNSRNSLLNIEKKLSEREGKNIEIQSSREVQGELRSTSENLTKSSLELKERVEKLTKAEGAECPLCNQKLNQKERDKLIQGLEAEVSSNRVSYQENQANLKDIVSQIQILEKELKEYQNLETERLSLSNRLSKLEENLSVINQSKQKWEVNSIQYQKLSEKLEKEMFLNEVRDELEDIFSKMGEIGYNVETHTELKKYVLEMRSAQNDFMELSIAKGAVKPVKDEIENLEKQISSINEEIEGQTRNYQEVFEQLRDADQNKPDIQSNEITLNDLQASESQLNREIGAARQRVSVLFDQRRRKKKLVSEREDVAIRIERLKTLERAFGKEGVPALLIEQALPEIETRANDLLERLSDGTMSIRFLTQAAYKDKKRTDLKETLDIQIMDGSGARDYEMFSGGEAFRVNFAIRLALSKVLSHRKGARLQTLVIDEGFGSQDNLGRQRLIEAINFVKGDFAKVLIITHLDELKDVFQTRIEVSKTENGSELKVI